MSKVTNKKKRAKIVDEVNSSNGIVSPNLRRLVEVPRRNWRNKVVADGLSYYNLDGIKWSEKS